MLHKFRNELALTVMAFEKGDGVGGTWYFVRHQRVSSTGTRSTRTCCASGTGRRGTWNSGTCWPTWSTWSSASTWHATSS
ncbi:MULTISPECIES: hypothetical protein [Amycolatopsis methanolica group]